MHKAIYHDTVATRYDDAISDRMWMLMCCAGVVVMWELSREGGVVSQPSCDMTVMTVSFSPSFRLVPL